MKIVVIPKPWTSQLQLRYAVVESYDNSNLVSVLIFMDLSADVSDNNSNLEQINQIPLNQYQQIVHT